MDANYPTVANSTVTNGAYSSSYKEVRAFMDDIKKRTDSLMNDFLGGFFVAGLLLAQFYDTQDVAWSVGGL